MNGIGTISIIMAAYNAEKTVAASVQSVMRQTYADWELLLIDDCSTDRTGEIAEAFAAQDPRIRVLHNPVNSGVSKTRRAGVDASSGAWLAVLDSDDLWQSDKLQKQVQTALIEDADLICTGSSFIDEEGAPYEWVLHVPRQITYRQLCFQNIISNSSVLVKKDVFLANCVEREDIHEDFACWLNVLKNDGKAVGIDEPLLIYRISRASRTGNKFRSALRNWRTYRAVGMAVPKALVCETGYMIKGVLKYKNIKG
ncbi:MAG: glycosyltransferase family 2 protein [Firmicutes bacterium]|nr:glycosyltransferase family 2 protein [Bacillota bacterium]